ncbi:MAG: type II secretion system protein [Sedimentisphaerales bacterium]|nr:type II secretion system protein [Sedimentisphaerales bacterium]
MSNKNKKNSGYVLIELTVAMFLLGVLLVAFALALNGFARFNRFQLIRQRCTAAAQAQLDSIATTGKPIAEEDFRRLWPRLEVSIKESDGTGQWQGLNLVEVETNGMSFNQKVKVRLSRYMAAKIPSAGQEQ